MNLARTLPIFGTLLVFPAGPLAAQDSSAMEASERLRVFLDCQRCDFDHLRREITFVDYVRDRADAQLHILVTWQSTGGGGSEYLAFFLGQGEFAGRQDTLRYVSLQDDTENETRDGLTRTLQLGLVPFAARTPIADGLSVDFADFAAGDGAGGAGSSAQDPWNLWVFTVRLSGSLEGESRQGSRSFDGSFRASRTTEDMKIDFSLDGDYSEDRFELNSGEELVSTTRNFDVETTSVWSVAGQWSAGIRASATSATRVNQDLTLRAAPAIEYSVYPYEESTRRQITFTYTVGAVNYNYEQATLFDRMEETLAEHEFEVSAGFQQPWGEIDMSLEGSAFLDDWSKHRLDAFSRFEIRLLRGLSLDVSGNIARIKNQIYVAREDISDEEILLRRRELGTDFEYELELGLNFSFGSVFNNVVNPRLFGGGGYENWR